MKKIILYKNGFSLCCGSDQLMYVDGRFNIESIKREVRMSNERKRNNFPHLVADGFRFCDNRLNEYGGIINI